MFRVPNPLFSSFFLSNQRLFVSYFLIWVLINNIKVGKKVRDCLYSLANFIKLSFKRQINNKIHPFSECRKLSWILISQETAMPWQWAYFTFFPEISGCVSNKKQLEIKDKIKKSFRGAINIPSMRERYGYWLFRRIETHVKTLTRRAHRRGIEARIRAICMDLLCVNKLLKNATHHDRARIGIHSNTTKNQTHRLWKIVQPTKNLRI